MRLALFLGLCSVGAAAAGYNEGRHTPKAVAVEKPAPPQWIISDYKALATDARAFVAEGRATLRAFNEGGVTVALTKPPKSEPIRLIPTVPVKPKCGPSGCPIVGKTQPSLPKARAPAAAKCAAAGGACGVQRRQPIRDWIRGRRR